MPLAELAGIAAESVDLRHYRTEVLASIASAVPFDAAIFHAFSPSVPLDTGVVTGLDPARVVASMHRWHDLGTLLGSIRERANRDGLATDEVLPRRARAAFRDEVGRPFAQRSLCMAHLVVRGRFVAALALFARRENAFDATHVAELGRLLPAIAAGDALHQALDGSPVALRSARMGCVDPRLTRRQREIVEHVALGHTNAQIGDALGLSPNSVRNHLARVFLRLGAANRAELVRLAVLSPT